MSKSSAVSKRVAEILDRDYTKLDVEHCAFAFVKRVPKYKKAYAAYAALPSDFRAVIDDGLGAQAIGDRTSVSLLHLEPQPQKEMTFGQWKNAVKSSGHQPSVSIRQDLLPDEFQLVRWIDPDRSIWDPGLVGPIFWRNPVFVHSWLRPEEATVKWQRVELKRAIRNRVVWTDYPRGTDDIRQRRRLQRDAEVAVVFNLLDPVSQIDQVKGVLALLRAEFEKKYGDLGNEQGNRDGRYGLMVRALELVETGATYEALSEAVDVPLSTFKKQITNARRQIDGQWRNLLSLLQ